MTEYMHPLGSRAASTPALAGGKAANLSRLIRLRYNVPAGFVVSTKAFSDFLARNQLTRKIEKALATIDQGKPPTFALASKTIKTMVLEALIPDNIVRELAAALQGYSFPAFAVRSSAVFEDSRKRSWAGQFDSFLHVPNTRVAASIKECWASVFNARAITYSPSAFKDVRHLRFAVVVQEMVTSDTAGVAFSVEPATNDPHTVLIEAVPGIGNALVSGSKHAFSALLDKKRGTLLRKSAQRDEDLQLLSIRQLRTLAQTAAGLEHHFRTPVDIEWAFRRNTLFLLQARPITTVRATVQPSRETRSVPNIANYELTFKVSGLSFLFADMLAHAFRYLDPLFTSDERRNFLQYFSNEKMRYAASFGMGWFSRPNSFKKYQRQFTDYYERHTKVLDTLLTKERLSRSEIDRSFQIMSRFLTYYSRMDNQFTDHAFLQRDRIPAVRHNLHLLSQFKDAARVWINHALINDDSHFSRLCDKLSEQLPRADVECYRVEDLAAFLLDGSRVPKRIVDDRRRAYVMFYAAGEQAYITGQKAVAYISAITAWAKSLDSSEIKGQVAHRRDRFLEGRVRLINVDYSDLAQVNQAITEMEPDEILVAEFTAPELLAACRKAKAVVTDIGGLLSHAAIVSRELDIPCLVGTGNGTRVLKSGDMVTIDFDLGTVKKHSG